jgi:hypothetical protein
VPAIDVVVDPGSLPGERVVGAASGRPHAPTRTSATAHHARDRPLTIRRYAQR